MKTTMIKIRLLALMLACALACALFALPATAYAAGSDGEEPGSEATGTWDDDTQSSDGHFLMAVPKSGDSAITAHGSRESWIEGCELIAVFDWLSMPDEDPIPDGTEVMVQLLADGSPDGEPVVLNAENNWQYKWSRPGDREYTVEVVSELPHGYELCDTQYGESVEWQSIPNGSVGFKYRVGSMVAASENCRYTSVPNRPVSVRKVWFLDKEDDQYRPDEVNVEAIFEHCHHDPSPDHEWVVLDESNGWRHVFPCTQKTYDRSFNEDLFYGFYKSITIEHFWDYPDYPVQSACIIVNVPIWKYGSREPDHEMEHGYTLSVTKHVGTIDHDSNDDWVLTDAETYDKDQTFVFTFTFTGRDDVSYEDCDYDVTDASGFWCDGGTLSRDGTCQVELRHGYTVTLSDLPGFMEYVVVESRCDGYEPSVMTFFESNGFVDFAAGSDTASGIMTRDTALTFINTPESKPGGYELPKTGGEGSMPYAIGGIAAMSLGLGGPLLIGKKRKHGDDRGGAGK